MSRTHHFMLCLIVWSICAFAHAGQNGLLLDSIRCGSDLVESGEPAFRLLEACGEPDYRYVVGVRHEGAELSERSQGQQLFVHSGASVVVENWIYKPGNGRFIRVVTVTGGQITAIEVQDRL